MRICMLSKTPLVGAPARLANALIGIGENVDLFTFEEYPNHLRGLFDKGRIISDIWELNHSKYDIAWVHNSIPDNQWKKFHEAFKNKPKFIQFHSGTHEPPLGYLKIENEPYSLFDFKLVVGQAWARMYPDATLIPNICNILRPQQRSMRTNLDILYSPSHSKGGRFGFKDSEHIKRLLLNNKEILANLGAKSIKIEILNRPYAQNDLLDLRTQFHVSIDETYTGGFHQVSIEAMCTGGVCVNGADIFSQLAFTNAIEANRLPPFITVENTENLGYLLREMVLSEELLPQKISESRIFCEDFLQPSRLAKIVRNRIKGLCDAN